MTAGDYRADETLVGEPVPQPGTGIAGGAAPGSTTGSTTGSTGAGSGSGVTGQAKEAAGTAADEGRHMAGVAQEQATNLASEAASHARNLLDEAQSQLEEQSRSQRNRLVETLSTFSDDANGMAEHGSDGLAAEAARQVATRTRNLSTWLDGREPRELLDEVRGFARRKPGTFLVGALAAGVVAGRFARSAASSGGGSSTEVARLGTVDPGVPAPTATGTADGAPLAGVDTPSEPLATPGTSVAADTSWSDVRGDRR